MNRCSSPWPPESSPGEPVKNDIDVQLVNAPLIATAQRVLFPPFLSTRPFSTANLRLQPISFPSIRLTLPTPVRLLCVFVILLLNLVVLPCPARPVSCLFPYDHNRAIFPSNTRARLSITTRGLSSFSFYSSITICFLHLTLWYYHTATVISNQSSLVRLDVAELTSLRQKGTTKQHTHIAKRRLLSLS